ncbi:MAG TPA: PIG-L family deacetylase [Polyangiaceae bacterium]|nr:PIG-L family deacetylase [Polyangiaceae bacterium]
MSLAADVTLGLSKPRAEVFVPDGIATAHALSRTTHLAVGAHPDDLELMAIHGILACLTSEAQWFAGVIATDGAGSPAVPGEPALSSAEAIREARRAEQKRAAELGRYGALVLLDHSSAEAKDPANGALTRDLDAVLRATAPEVVYTHNLADAHDTHVAVALSVIAACRALPDSDRPKRVIGCEVWRDLDWLAGEAKVALPVDGHEELEGALIQVFESQLRAGKRLDTGALGRRRANATFNEIRASDVHEGIVWGMDLTRAAHGQIDPVDLLAEHLRVFENDVLARIRRFTR